MESTAPRLIVRVETPEDLDHLARVPLDRVAWVETSMAMAAELGDFPGPVDILLKDPAAEAKLLYRLTRLFPESLPRVSIPALKGVEKASAVAMALNLPVRLIPLQPDPEAVKEMEAVLHRYLHDSGATAPVEPFHGALATHIHGDPARLWQVVERDPERYEHLPTPLPEKRRGEECATCPHEGWCDGYFKAPDPTYVCTDVRRLLGQIDTAVAELRRDLAQAP